MKKGKWVDVTVKILRMSNVVFHQSSRKGQTCIATEGWKRTQTLAKKLEEHLVVKQPLVQKLLEYKPARNNRFPSRDEVLKRAELLDYVHEFNKGKNRQWKWNGSMILEFYGYS